MADYTTTTRVKNYLLGAGTNAAWNTNDDATLAEFVTAHSRSFDQETGKPPSFWAAASGVVRKYRGDGGQWLEVEPLDALTAATMSTLVDRSDAVALSFTDTTSTYYAVKYPLTGPPYSRIFLRTAFWPDTYRVGNVWVTGDVSLPAEVQWAVTAWAAHSWKARTATWADAIVRDGTSHAFSRKIPDDVQRVIRYYRGSERRVFIV